MDTPLLSDQDDSARPSLGPTAGSLPVDPHESPLSRLIAESTSLTLPLPDAKDEEWTLLQAPAPKTSVTSLIAGILSLLHMGLTFGSYLGDAWCDLRLQVSYSTNPTIDTVVRSLDLASILTALQHSQQYGALVALAFTSLLVPCACMMLLPMWILQDYQLEALKSSCFRTTVDSMLRTSLVALYVVVLLSIPLSFIQMDWTKTNLQLHTQLRGGLVAYSLGAMAAMTLLMLQRWGWSRSMTFPQDRETLGEPIRPPPQRAFSLPWRVFGEQDTNALLQDDHDDDEPQQHNIAETADSSEPLELESSVPYTFPQKAMAVEATIFAAILWIPIFALPLFRFDFKGLAYDFMPLHSRTVYLAELPMLLWQQGQTAETSHWILLALQLILIVSVFGLPLIASLLALTSWMVSSKALKRQWRWWLYALQPTCNGLVFSLVLVFTIPAMDRIATYFLNQHSLGICQQMEQFVGEGCLHVEGTILLGSWVLLLQAILCELMVVGTIAWL